MRIPSGVTDKYIYFVAVDSADFTTRETGLSSFTVYRSRNGGAAAAMTTPTINETDATNMPGVYELLLDEDMTIDSGDDEQEMVFHVTHAGMAPVTRAITLYRSKITTGYTLNVAADGDIGGNVDGAVASVTGAVGSVTGNVGGNVVGSVASVTGNVGGNVTGSVGSVSGHTPQTADNNIILAAISAKLPTNYIMGSSDQADHDGDFDAVTLASVTHTGAVIPTVSTLTGHTPQSGDTYGALTDAQAEPGQGAPAANASALTKIAYLFKSWRNKKTQTADTWTLFNDDGTTAGQAATVSDDGTTATKGEIGTGA